ncbi:thiamine biosynthesis lipoprotein [Arthrobacter woluwensis]|uniref:FAD:protein FMN transferase n=1 Tax=Arthrobacter woluwensis TaxID=156980 RepID=A0A1H4N4C3_9MICC|nr:thiamine biosynthesis lipoprotein [Arthrobacter woluwensis]
MPVTTNPLEFDAIGTRWWIRAEGLTDRIESRIRQRIDEFDAVWSRFRPDSAVARWAAGPVDPDGAERTLTLPAEAAPLGRLYRELHDLSAGSVTPFIGESLVRLGYDASYSLTPHGPAVAAPAWGPDARWEDRTVTASGPVLVDIGAAGKGLLVDLVCGILGDAGVSDYLVDAGGDLRHSGPEADRIGLESPFDGSRAIGVVAVHQQALAASGTARRAWGRGLHHVLDGLTGEPVRRVVASWVLAPDALQADGLATALFFVPGHELAARYGVEWLTVHSDGHAEGSEYFLEGLF